MAGYYGFMFVVLVSSCLSVIHPSVHIFVFWTITWVNINGFSPKLVCALILWGSGLGLLMGELSAKDMPVFSFLDDNLIKCLGICIDIVEIWFGIAYGQILSVFDRSYLPETCTYIHFQTITWVNVDGFSPLWQGIMLAMLLFSWKLGFDISFKDICMTLSNPVFWREEKRKIIQIIICWNLTLYSACLAIRI